MILVTGANGVVGNPLCARLKHHQIAYKTVSRVAGHSIQWDLHQPANEQVLKKLSDVKTVIHCAPIWLLPDHLENLRSAGVQQIIVFSSTSAISKRQSTDTSEVSLVNSLLTAESALQDFCSLHGLALVVLRPAMIYGYGRDQNIMQIANFIRRWGFAVLAGQAAGLRQPVHADDLVSAALIVKDNDNTEGLIYNLAGGEVLSYQEMVKRIFLGLGKKARILYLPTPLYRIMLRLAALFIDFSYTAEMANRMSQDLVYDNTQAQVDFGYQPQSFLQQPKRDLVQASTQSVASQ